MGKQSRRKKKAKGQDKRAKRRTDQATDLVDEYDNELAVEEIDVRSRVWYKPIDNDGSGLVQFRRAIVKQVIESEQKETGVLYRILPLEKEDKTENYVERTAVWIDTTSFCPKYSVGDVVVDHASNHYDNNIISEIQEVFPRIKARFFEEYGKIPLYLISTVGDGLQRVVYDEAELGTYNKPRYKVGDHILFASKHASHPRLPDWVDGKVVTVDYVFRNDNDLLYIIPYEIEFFHANNNNKRRKSMKCFIPFDSDECITRADATSRERFFDAISQDCTMEHLDYLVQSSGLEIKLILDLVIDKAISEASYNGLNWLQNCMEVDLSKINNNDNNANNGEGILQQIVRSSNAHRFFEKASKLEGNDDNINLLSLGLIKADEALARRRDKDGRLFLHQFVLSKKYHLLELVLSPHTALGQGLAKEFERMLQNNKRDDEEEAVVPHMHLATMDNSGFNLRDLAEKQTRFDMVKMIDELARSTLLVEMRYCLRYCSTPVFSTFAKSFLPKFGSDESNATIVRSLIKFIEDAKKKEQSNVDFAAYFKQIVDVGDVHCISWICEGGHPDTIASLLNSKYWLKQTTKNRDEFIQPELVDETDTKPENVYLDVISVAAHGRDLLFGREYAVKREHIQKYQTMLLSKYFIHLKTTPPDASMLISELERFGKSSDYKIAELFKYKMSLLRGGGNDQEKVKQKLDTLEYLVDELKLSPPRVVDVIRWRKNEVLQWLVGRGVVDLAGLACKDSEFVAIANEVHFLGNHMKIPGQMKIGEFLSFLAVEFDDLQCLNWLLKERGVSLRITCNGWNLVHACAAFGRLEIFCWVLKSHVGTEELVKAPSSRKKSEHMFAVHLAIERGCIAFADVLLNSGCPVSDKRGKSLILYTKRSSYEHVRDWGIKKEKPSMLQHDMDVLRDMMLQHPPQLSLIKQHLTNSKCMVCERWYDYECFRYNIDGPSGMSYVKWLSECCSLIDNADFVCWLLQHISANWEVDRCVRDEYAEFWEEETDIRFGINTPTSVPMPQLVAEIDDQTSSADSCWQDLMEFPWCRHAQIHDPINDTFFSKIIESLPDTEATKRGAKQFCYSVRSHTVLGEMFKATDGQLRLLFTSGASLDEITIVLHVLRKLEILKETKFGSNKIDRRTPIHPTGKVNLEFHMHMGYSYSHRLFKQSICFGAPGGNVHKLYHIWAVEGFEHLIRWSLQPEQNMWDARKEYLAARTAAFFGHADVVSLFIERKNNVRFSSTFLLRLRAAVFGAAEAGRQIDLGMYWELAVNAGFTVKEIMDKGESFSLSSKEDPNAMTSFVGVALRGYLVGAGEVSRVSTGVLVEDDAGTLFWILSKLNLPPNILLTLACSDQIGLHAPEHCSRLIDLYEYMLSCLELNLWKSASQIRLLCNIFMDQLGHGNEERKIAMKEVTFRWLRIVQNQGISIQPLLDSDNFRFIMGNQFLEEVVAEVKELQKTQQLGWMKFECIKKGQPLPAITEAIESGALCLSSYDENGLLPSHLCAAYDRVDVLDWLITEKSISLLEKDAYGRSVLDVAVASDALKTSSWASRRIAEQTLARFLSLHYHRRRSVKEYKRRLRGIIRCQAVYRGFLARRFYRENMVLKLGDAQRFQAIWGPCVKICNGLLVDQANLFTWEAHKETLSDVAIPLDEVWLETSNMLDNAFSDATQMKEDNNETDDGFFDEGFTRESCPQIAHAELSLPTSNTHCVKFTKYAVKWLKGSDAKYRGFFVSKIKRLACGDRSRTMAKRLTGTNKTVFETYLEQKSGHRILWTNEQDLGLVIWYVVAHDKVSKAASLIDRAEERTQRRLTDADDIPEMKSSSSISAPQKTMPNILLDPLGNVPLKLYDVSTDDFDAIETNEDWRPRLFLTPEEKQIVECKGTTLVLGRSGTGKTLCICNRMEYDRDHGTTSQLFVARSKRLCNAVKKMVGESPGIQSDYYTFLNWISHLESRLPDLDGNKGRRTFPPSQKIGLRRFQREFSKSDSCVSSHTVWSNIRTFIKGSIESVLDCKPMNRETYLSLGRKACRLGSEQRLSVFNAFEKYEKIMSEEGLWDDCDRIATLIERLVYCRSEDPELFHSLCRGKIYVDEVQDYTQAEIALFFLLSGPDNLFLAGDAAQAVDVVEFRFEDIRAVGYKLYSENRDLIPDKPKTVNVNFRSHSGILNVAAGILVHLFSCFPDSARQLPEDRGLFVGPRPSVFEYVPMERLNELVNKVDGLAVLTHDSEVQRVKNAIGGYKLVYGIREAKGLEFKAVVLVDFFVNQSKRTQRPWRDIFLGRDKYNVRDTFPEMEGELKLLYTAITRSISTLFFAETASSIGGKAFYRWLTEAPLSTNSKRGITMAPSKLSSSTEPLAVKQRVDDVERMSHTPDEWRAIGIDNGILAELEEDPLEAIKSTERAIHCFVQIGDDALCSKVRAHHASAEFRNLLKDLNGNELQEKNCMQDSTGATTSSDSIEIQASHIIARLLLEGLHIEAQRVCIAVLPYIKGSSKEFVESRLSEKLQSLAQI